MKIGKIIGLAVVFLFLLTVAGLGQTEPPRKEICLTFDDLPVVRVPDRVERIRITDQILSALDSVAAPAAGFVVGNNIGEEQDLLGLWRLAGHVLGNHTWSHADISEIPLSLYLQNIKKGQDVLEPLLKDSEQPHRYFRPPLLHYGSSRESRESVSAFLDSQKCVLVGVSIDNDDYLYNMQYERLSAGPDSIQLPQLGEEYCAHIMERLAAAEQLAVKVVGRPIRHILLLHANRLNGAFLPVLLSHIKARGYDFISLDSALADPVYSIRDSYLGSKGLSILERLDISPPIQIPEDSVR